MVAEDLTAEEEAEAYKPPLLELRGGNWLLYNAEDDEILAEGPAGTGKTRTNLENLYRLCDEFPGFQGLMVRKIGVTMAASCIKEFREHVLAPGDGVRFFGGSQAEPAAFKFPNGSQIVVSGMDNPDKVLSSWYDAIYVNEAADLALADWETLTTRLRGSQEGMNPVSRITGQEFHKRRIFADTNPTFERHWLMQRSTPGGATRLIRSKLQDNPAYYDHKGRLTQAGEDYVRRLDRLTGMRYERFRLGLRVGVENAIYPHFRRELHMRPIPAGLRFVGGAIGVDYGEEHLAAVVAILLDQYRRHWIVEVWAEPAEDHGRSLAQNISRIRETYRISRGRVDPNQGFMAGRINASVADKGPGTRMHRTVISSRLFNVFPGGRVTTLQEELQGFEPLGPYPIEMDSPGLLLAQYPQGDVRNEQIEALADEIEAYQMVAVISPQREVMVVKRVNEDRVAAMEYANEELEEPDAAYVFTHESAAALAPHRYRPADQPAAGRRSNERGF